MRTRTWLLVLALASCNKTETKQAEPANGSGSAATAVAAPSNTVQIFIDDQPVGTIASEQLGLWPRVDSLVPMASRRLGTWQTIALTKGPGQSAKIEQPSNTYPELVPALFPGEGGRPAFGMFDPVELAKKGKPTLREDGISELRIALAKGSGRGENDHQGGEATDPTQLKLTIKSAKGEQVIEGTKLLELPRQPQPGDERSDPKGWPLSVILAQAGVTKYERLLLSDGKGANLTLEKQDLDPKTAIPFVKLNRQGSLRFRVFKKQGDHWQPAADLRGLAHVEVLK